MIARSVKKVIPQNLTNRFWHLPKAFAANLTYGFPSRKLTVIGVTGTDGKTTTINMIYQILKKAGKKVSMTSTINAQIAGSSYDTGFHVTNPSTINLQKYLKMAADNGDDYFVMEVTSHGLDQFRTWGIKFDIAVITNITNEHLDYHKSFDNYLKAKGKLINNSKTAILNRDEDHFMKLRSQTKGKIITFGMHKTADFNPIKFPLKLIIPGDYNIYNALAATATCIQLGIDSKIVKQALSEFSSLKGRMDEVKNNSGARIFIDFAHTPNALENALLTLKKLKTKEKRIIAVFGCASERDSSKRVVMGEISGSLADITIITAEDPRFEDPLKIADEIKLGVIKLGGVLDKTFFIEPDRQKAINLAIKLANKGDVVGIFGKGHEMSMNIKGVETPWSDFEAVEKALHERG